MVLFFCRWGMVPHDKRKETAMTIQIEKTDLYGGEANYSWVHRHEIEVSDNITHLSLMRMVKNAVGWNGLKCKVEHYGDMIEIRPYKMNEVTFVTF